MRDKLLKATAVAFVAAASLQLYTAMSSSSRGDNAARGASGDIPADMADAPDNVTQLASLDPKSADIKTPAATPSDKSDAAKGEDGKPDAGKPDIGKTEEASPATSLDPAHTKANGWVDEGDTGPREHIETMRRGDTMMTVLLRAGVSRQQAVDAIEALKPVFTPKELKPGLEIRVSYTPLDPAAADEDPADTPIDLQGVTFQPTVERIVTLTRTTPPSQTAIIQGNAAAQAPTQAATLKRASFTATETRKVLTKEMARGGGVIDSSLFKSGLEAGVPTAIMFELIRVFSYDVDFQREIQPGDRFEVLYERMVDENGQALRTGLLRYATLTLSGTTLRLYRFDPKDGGPADYFNRKGESVKKALLKTPIDGAKLTSGFGMRGHPILGFSRMHKGVDFGAGSGTPINAAGDGTIDYIGPFSGYGNYVRIKHSNQYATAYAHMSRFASGLKVGSRVHQGQVIGFVGMTGLATGPHLHYEVLVNMQQINPLSVKLPTGRKLDGKDLAAFNAAVGGIERERDALPDPLPDTAPVAVSARIARDAKTKASAQ